MLPADLIAFPGLYFVILKIHIIELDLNHFNFRMIGQNLIQSLRGIVERHAQMTDFSFLLQFQCDFKGSCAFILLHAGSAEGVHQIEVKVFHTAGIQLLLEQRTDVLFLLEVVGRQLVGQNVPVPGITGRQTFFDGQFTFSVDVAVSGIKVIETVFQEHVHHPGGLRNIYFICDHGKAHITKTEIFLNLFKRAAHIGYLRFVFYSIPLNDCGKPSILYLNFIHGFCAQQKTLTLNHRRARLNW